MTPKEKESSDKSEHSKCVSRLADRLKRLNAIQLAEVELCVSRLECNDATVRAKESGDKSPHSRDWPHAPLHRLSGKGTYIVTAGTLHKEHFFRDADRLDYLERELLSKAQGYEWQIEAWAVFSNHYHFVGHAMEDAGTLKPMLTQLARSINVTA